MRTLARKQAIRDGLIAAPPSKKKEDARPPGVAAAATKTVHPKGPEVSGVAAQACKIVEDGRNEIAMAGVL